MAWLFRDMPYFIVSRRYEYDIRYYNTNLIKFLYNLELYFLFKILIQKRLFIVLYYGDDVVAMIDYKYICI